ncbi:MAG: cytochrome P450 [Pararhodobacter sp.]
MRPVASPPIALSLADMSRLPRISQSPVDPAFVQDPYPFYDRLRDLGPLVIWQEYDLPVATRHAGMNALLRDRRLGREAPRCPVPGHMAVFAALQADSILELEPPRQRQLRAMVQAALTPPLIAAQEPVIETLACALIDCFPASGTFDLVSAYTKALPAQVILQVMGLPEVALADLQRWSEAMVGVYQAGSDHAREQAAEAAATQFADHVAAAIAQHCARPRPEGGMLDRLIAASEAGDGLNAAELLANTVLVLNAAREATVHALGNAVASILTHGAPSTRQAWLAPGQIDETVEECLRFDPPLHLFTRHIYDPVDVMGQRLPAGGQVICLLGAAGRDPARTEAPHRFDPFRPVKPHLAFSAGVHFCLGAMLARLELKVALRVLFARCPGLELVAPPVFADSYHFRGPTALMVRAA